MKGKPAGWRRRGPIAVLLDRLDRRITPQADARAREAGLEIIRIPGTRMQVYRDRRFDLRGPCCDCGGTGADGAHFCTSCDGFGVVTHDLATAGEWSR
jgi:hypothetical protein